MTNVEPVNSLNLDPSAQQSFIRYYHTLSEKPTTTVRIFNRIDYYSCHGEDAKLAAQEIFHSTAVVKRMGADQKKLDYLVLSKSNFEKFVRELLLIKQYQVEVYVNQGTNKNNDWILEYKGSPGNLSQFEEILFENTDVVVNSIVIGVKMGPQQLLGVSCVNLDDRIFSVCEFTDNEFFSQLESLIIQISPRECLLQMANSESATRLRTILERSNILCCQLKKTDPNSLTQDLDRLLHFAEGQQESCLTIPEIDFKTAITSLHGLINHLELTTDTSLFNRFKIKILDTKRFAHLDSAAVKALNVLPKQKTDRAAAKMTSLLGYLDDCRTVPGRRLLEQWVKQPLRDINTIQNRLDIVEFFVNEAGLRRSLHDEYLRRIPDLMMLSKKLMRKKAKLQDIYKVYQCIDKLPYMVAALREHKHKTIQSMFVDNLSDFLNDMDKFQRMVESTLDMDLIDQGEYFVKSSFDEDLADLYEKKNILQEKIQKQLTRVARDLDLDAGKGVKLEYTDQLGYFFRVTLKDEPVLRKHKQYKILSTIRGGARFVHSDLEELSTDYQDIKKEYEEKQKSVVAEILGIAAGYADTLNNINLCIAQLDVLVSFANVVCAAPKQLVKPILHPTGTGIMKLIQIRHPCIEVQDGISFNPNDIEFKRDECTFHIITGPNMGGKSTYIRSVAVVVLMAQIGCFVPCDEAELSIVDSILARVGSEDCQAKGISTFMLEMIETAGILRTATENSLVVIDELGRGTSTYEGCGIAWAIAEHLTKEIKAFTMFATHFHEITNLARELPTVCNQHVTAMVTDNNLTLLYQVKPGVCDQSFGIHVAKMAGFPQEFLDLATVRQHELEGDRYSTKIQELDAETRQKILLEGDCVINETLDRLQKIDHKRMSDEDLQENIKKFKVDILEKNNIYLNTLLGK